MIASFTADEPTELDFRAAGRSNPRSEKLVLFAYKARSLFPKSTINTVLNSTARVPS